MKLNFYHAQRQSWEQDFHLQDPGRLALFDEYLEMSTLLKNIAA